MPLSDAAYNERTKLTATWLNNLSTGVLLAGVIIPTVAAFSGVAPWVDAGPELGLAASASVVLGYVLHFGARRLLRGLR
jgi:MFS superfamily sulfate permease-like transporter